METTSRPTGHGSCLYMGNRGSRSTPRRTALFSCSSYNVPISVPTSRAEAGRPTSRPANHRNESRASPAYAAVGTWFQLACSPPWQNVGPLAFALVSGALHPTGIAGPLLVGGVADADGIACGHRALTTPRDSPVPNRNGASARAAGGELNMTLFAQNGPRTGRRHSFLIALVLRNDRVNFSQFTSWRFRTKHRSKEPGLGWRCYG